LTDDERLAVQKKILCKHSIFFVDEQ